MNIMIIGPAYPLRGGIAHFNALLVTHLEQKHHVETITFKRQYPKLLFPGTTQEETGGTSGAEAAPQLLDSINPLNWNYVAREVMKGNPDVLVFQYFQSFFGPCYGRIAKLVKRRTGIPIVFICHNIIPHERRPGDLLLMKYAFTQADGFIVQADSVERDLLTYFPNARYRKAPHPVYESFGVSIPKDRARTALGISAKKVMLFFGYIRAYKGLLVLIDAMKLLHDQGINDIHLLVVGEFYDDEAKYRSSVRELGLDAVVQFVSEYVPNEAVASYFSAADVVVLPYRSATQSGIVQIAYNFDTPVIATNTGGLGEVVVDGVTGFLVPPDAPNELARAISRFYSEHREVEFSENVKTEKQKYSWDYFAGQLDDLFTELQTKKL